MGDSAKVKKLLKMARQVAPTPATVLITGEHGTGKEILARTIHDWSDRSGEPFVIIDCASIAPNLLESELFGHVKGAFTGADKTKQGYFELAGDGTVFLDEIGEMPKELQARLLRVIQYGQFSRVGDAKLLKTNARIIAATNRDLPMEVKEGRFREDLYYRLNVFAVESLPLREIKSDIPLLMEHFIGIFNNKFGKEVKGASEEALQALMAFDWPGNIREFRNMMERIFIMIDGDRIEAFDLPGHIRNETGEADSEEEEGEDDSYLDIKKRLHDDIDRRMVVNWLKEKGGNVTKAAQSAGMHRTTLQRLMRKFGIDSSKFKKESEEDE